MAKLVYVADRIPIPDGVEVRVEGRVVRVKGPLGEVVRDFGHAENVFIRVEGGEVVVEAYRVKRRGKAVIYTIGSHIRNMITGVTKGYRYVMKIVFSHFPVTVTVDKQNKLVKIRNFLGEKADRVAEITGNVDVKVSGDEIVITGVDVEEVGQTAANIEKATGIKDKDRRIFVDGIYLVERGEGFE